ncbi:hypothetical protein CJ030_MR5G017364 [Morella rubra]|uniref:Ribosome biogenesis protein NOP53 n=1 Tax=Morella rubra TaxID=262757 RepID=A0A6A1VMJ3_9ROSI|nr:hypothetical protein CJ030_MR5G017364 [Morella rubra]
MGKKAKSSRKGKKAWRANISTEEIEDFFEKSTKDALSGGPLSSAPADSLFVVDKSRDVSMKRKIEKNREKDDSATVSGMADMWDEKGKDNSNTRKKWKPSVIAAVEVEPPGCSFNPVPESHQDVLAHAVAEEMQKVYQNELGPQPVPLTVPGEVVDEEEMYFIEADNGSDDDGENLGENEDAALDERSCKTKRVTRVVLNKRARHKERLRKESEARKVEELSKEIDSLPDIIQEIAKDDEEKQKRHLRRVVAKQERLKSCPPRLGRHKFEPAPVQVLLSEEISGSLRKLKGCCTLAKDRYKSLEKRGLIVPTAKNRR